ncbi:hypothetical protein GOV08_00750 [Candidatus Woesearchaeota archaeon]|nr:hypothetical protein [Candidatus Woesearchaeota archaeon]
MNFEDFQKQVEKETNGVVIKKGTFDKYYFPLILSYIDDRKKKKIKTYIIGIQGCQGVGKTVLATLIKIYLKNEGVRVEGFSIDDYYKSDEERLKISKKYEGNPFYQISRGMPGTHRHDEMFDALKKAKEGKNFFIPQFDKSIHNGRGEITKEKIRVDSLLDFLIVEGWCVNVPYVKDSEFIDVMQKNSYVKEIFDSLDPEKKHFKDMQKYTKSYQDIWGLFDNKTVMLAKNIEWVEQWRAEQEERMIKAKGSGMTREQIHEFVKPYLPYTWLLYDKAAQEKEGVYTLMLVGWNHLPMNLKSSN